MKLFCVSSADPDFDDFVRSAPGGGIAQTIRWGQIYALHPDRRLAWALGVRGENGEILASAVVCRMRLPLGREYLFAPLGPVWTSAAALDVLLAGIRALCRERRAVFFRADDPARGDLAPDFFPSRGFRWAHAQKNPEWTWVTDLHPSPAELRASMRETGRRNLRKAESAGLTLREIRGADPAEIARFAALMGETTARDGFSAPETEQFARILSAFGASAPVNQSSSKPGGDAAAGSPVHRFTGSPPAASLFLAERDGELHAGAIVTFFGSTATYLYGASGSSPAARESRAPYLLHFGIMLEARRRGFSEYDWLGVAAPVNEAIGNRQSVIGGASPSLVHLSHAGEIRPLEPIELASGSSAESRVLDLAELETQGTFFPSTPDEFISDGVDRSEGGGSESAEQTNVGRGEPREAGASLRVEYEPDPKHPFAGITQFKTRFPGRLVRHAGAWELVFDPVSFAGLVGMKKLALLRKTVGETHPSSSSASMYSSALRRDFSPRIVFSLASILPIRFST